jgi:hypothetical protein
LAVGVAAVARSALRSHRPGDGGGDRTSSFLLRLNSAEFRLLRLSALLGLLFAPGALSGSCTLSR